jgi:hypothetical protein
LQAKLTQAEGADFRLRDPYNCPLQKGSEGVLCGSCADGYTYSNALSVCVECGSSPSLLTLFVFGAIAFFGVMAGVLRLCGLRISAKSGMKLLQVPPFNLLKHFDKGMLKSAWITFREFASHQMRVVFPHEWPLSKSRQER